MDEGKRDEQPGSETFKRMLVLHLEELKGLEGRGSLEAARHHHRDAERLNEQGRGKSRP